MALIEGLQPLFGQKKSSHEFSSRAYNTLKMHLKTLKCKKWGFNEEKNTKRDQGMLDRTKTHFSANFHTFMMIIS